MAGYLGDGMEQYRDRQFWEQYYEKNRQYVGNRRKLGCWTVLKDKRLYEDNAYALEALARGDYDRITPGMFRQKRGFPWGGKKDKSRQAAQGEKRGAVCGKVVYHAYWHGAIGEKQALSLKSCICTQKQADTEIWLWLDVENGYEGYEENEYLRPLLPWLKVLPFDAGKEIQGTPYEDYGWMFCGPELTFRADGFRLLALYQYGGVYFDLDVLFLKPLSPVLSAGEFCYAWESQPYANNALLYLKKGGELAQRLTEKALRLETFRPWQLLVYGDRALSSYIVYPSPFFDPLWMRRPGDQGYLENFEDFFTKPVIRENPEIFAGMDFTLENQPFFPGAYAHHWHNRWKTEIHPDSAFRWFEKVFDQRLDISNGQE